MEPLFTGSGEKAHPCPPGTGQAAGETARTSQLGDHAVCQRGCRDGQPRARRSPGCGALLAAYGPALLHARLAEGRLSADGAQGGGAHKELPQCPAWVAAYAEGV